MLSFHAHLKVFAATAPCDLRMSFSGLWNVAQQQLGEDPKSGALFAFTNRRHNRIKILYFDGTRVAAPICLEPQDRLELERWVAAHGTPQQVTQRCRIILAAAAGGENQEVARDLEINPKTVALWRTRFGREGTDCLWEVAPGRGRKPHYDADKVAAIIEQTHDYKRNGTTTLFAALEVLQGKVVGECYARHRHQEFLNFLKRLDRGFPQDLKLHVVMDNYGTHKHPRVQNWLQRHPRFVPHFIPTSSSWLNLVERWFGELTGKRIRRGVFVSVEDLQQAIAEFLTAWNAAPQPFVWTATVDSIVEKLNRCRQTLERIKPGCTRPRMRKNKGK